MSKKLFFECYSGISGDMTVGALLDLGADEKILRKGLKSLKLAGYDIKISRAIKSSLDVCDFDVVLDAKHENHDHDMKYLYGNNEKNSCNMTHEEHTHTEEHNGDLQEHMGDKHTHTDMQDNMYGNNADNYVNHEHHEHRGIDDILRIINAADEITDNAKKIAINIFEVLAEAEASVHGTTRENVHFHEVGAVDSIVDIVAIAICIDNIGISDIIVPEVYDGHGTIRCQHGIIPVPVPVVTDIAKKYNLNIHITDTESELVTPTGAAVIAAIRTSDRLPQKVNIIKTGAGAGKRENSRTGFMRIMILETDTDNESGLSNNTDEIVKLEANIDDTSGEALGFVMDKLFEAGALDVTYKPVFMKKNRPAYELNVICKKEIRELLENIIFTDTTTIGIRYINMNRRIMDRRIERCNTVYGEAEIKVCSLGNILKIYPEYSSVSKLASNSNVSFQTVYNEIIKSYNETNE